MFSELEREALRARVIMLIGATDTGKSTLAASLARAFWEKGRDCAVVDADVGQSDIGPPGCIGMGLIKDPIASLGEVPAEAFYFVGAFSPHGKMLECVMGAHLMVERALASGAEHVIIDTTGYVSGPRGRALKLHKLDAVRPDMLVLIQRGGELSYVLRAMRGRRSPRCLVMPCDAGVRRRGPGERADNRRRALAAHLKAASLRRIRIDEVALLHWPIFLGTPLGEGRIREISKRLGSKVVWAEDKGGKVSLVLETPMGYGRRAIPMRTALMGPVEVLHQGQFRNRLVGLDDDLGDTKALGVIHRMDIPNQLIEVWAVPMEEEIKGIRFSWLKADTDSWTA